MLNTFSKSVRSIKSGKIVAQLVLWFVEKKNLCFAHTIVLLDASVHQVTGKIKMAHALKASPNVNQMVSTTN